MAQTPNEVTVYLMGQPVATVHLDETVENAQDAIVAAAKQLGVNLNPTRVSVIKNGEQVDGNAPVQGGDTLATATGVANG